MPVSGTFYAFIFIRFIVLFLQYPVDRKQNLKGDFHMFLITLTVLLLSPLAMAIKLTEPYC